MAYGKSGERSGVHREEMHQHGFWTKDDEWDGFKRVAEDYGKTPVGLVKAIGKGELLVVRRETEGRFKGMLVYGAPRKEARSKGPRDRREEV